MADQSPTPSWANGIDVPALREYVESVDYLWYSPARWRELRERARIQFAALLATVDHQQADITRLKAALAEAVGSLEKERMRFQLARAALFELGYVEASPTERPTDG